MDQELAALDEELFGPDGTEGNVGALEDKFPAQEEDIGQGVVTAAKIATNAVTADKISVTKLSAIAADMGTVTAGTFKTASGTGNRVELSSEEGCPIWIGSGSKKAANSVFYMDSNGDVVFKETLNVKSASTSERLEINGSQLKDFDSSNVLRMELGVLS